VKPAARAAVAGVTGLTGRRRLLARGTLVALGVAPWQVAAPSPAPSPASGFKAGTFDPPHPAPDFTLQGSDGQPLTLQRLRGKVVQLVFGFTNCLDVCPVTMHTLSQARQLLGPAEAAGLQGVYVTVDPERDTVPQLKRYLAAYDPSFLGATGTAKALEDMRTRYGVVAKKVQQPTGYAVNHSSSVYLIDRAGRLRAMMPYGRSPKDHAHDVRLLLAA